MLRPYEPELNLSPSVNKSAKLLPRKRAKRVTWGLRPIRVLPHFKDQK